MKTRIIIEIEFANANAVAENRDELLKSISRTTDTLNTRNSHKGYNILFKTTSMGVIPSAQPYPEPAQ